MHNIKLLYEKCNKNNGIYILICNDLFKWHGIISFFYLFKLPDLKKNLGWPIKRQGVIPRQITQGPTWPVSDVSEKITKNTAMCSKDTNKILDANHY